MIILDRAQVEGFIGLHHAAPAIETTCIAMNEATVTLQQLFLTLATIKLLRRTEPLLSLVTTAQRKNVRFV